MFIHICTHTCTELVINLKKTWDLLKINVGICWMFLAEQKFIAKLLHLMETKPHSATIGKDIADMAPSP